MALIYSPLYYVSNANETELVRRRKGLRRSVPSIREEPTCLSRSHTSVCNQLFNIAGMV